MDVRLEDGTVISNVPDGITRSELMARVAKMKPPADTAVAVNSANKGIAAIPDALLNTPSNIMNLGKAAFGMGANAMGREDLMPEMSPPPNLASRAMRGMGFTSEQNEPKTGKQRMIDALVQGGIGAAITPAKSGAQLAKNILMGEAAGGAAGGVKEATGNDALAMSAGMLANAAPSAAARVVSGTPRPMNEVKAKTLADAEGAGYVVPPSEKTDSFVGNRLEGVAGKAALKQAAILRNQGITDDLAAVELGFPKGTALTPAKLKDYREGPVSDPYREVAALSPVAAAALEKLKIARHEAQVYQKHYEVSADPKSLTEAKSQRAKADVFEGVIDTIAQRAGKPDLPDRLAEARTQLAKSYDVERNLNVGDASVSAPGLGRMLDKNKPLTGGLKTSAAFAEGFPQYAREGSGTPTPGVGKAEGLASALLGTTGMVAAGPGGLMAAGLPFLSSPTRSMLLSGPYQKMIGNAGNGDPNVAMRTLMIANLLKQNQGENQ